MNKFVFKNNEVSFEEHSTGLCQAFIDGISIPLLFEKQLINEIVFTLKELRLDENIPFEYFKQIVSGCIKIHMNSSLGS
jgi:hypothetical protein